MLISILIVTTIGLVLGRVLFRTYYNPLFIFNLWWFTLSALSSFGLYNVFPPNRGSIQIVLIGVITFNLAIIILQIRIPKDSDKLNVRITQAEHVINYKFVNLALTIVLIFTVFESIDTVKLFISGVSMGEIRSIYYQIGEGGGRSTYTYYVTNFIIQPLSYSLIVITILDQLKGQRRTYLLLFTIIVIVATSFTSAGRFLMVNTVIMLIFAIMIIGRTQALRISEKIGLGTVGFLFVVGIIYITEARQLIGQNENLLYRIGQTTYTYYLGSLTYMGYLLEAYPISAYYSYGASFMGGILNPIFSVLAFLNILPYPSFMQTIAFITGGQLQIGQGVFFNAMPTIFMYFYIDAGFLGVILGTVVFALFCTYLYKNMKINYDCYWIALYLLILIQLNNMSTRWFFNAPGYFLAFIVLGFAFRKVKKKNESLQQNSINEGTSWKSM